MSSSWTLCAKRKVSLPDECDHLAADALLGALAAREQARRRGHDGGAEAAEDARQAVLARVHAPPGARHALQVREHPLAVLAELQLDHEGRERLARLDSI